MKQKILLIISLLLVLFGCNETADNTVFNVAVYIPGVVEGSPTYEMLYSGVEKAVTEKSATMQLIEAGFNQGEWLEKLQALAQTGNYDLIITSNPAMPELCKQVAEIYPEQKFAVLDAYLEGNDSIFTFRFNQFEQAFIAGYFAGLVTKSNLANTNDQTVVGLLAGQEYPDMNQAIRPGYMLGLNNAVGTGEVIFKVLGNWYDAEQAAKIAENMIASGADVILPIAGGGNQGVLTAAKSAGIYVQWFDSNGYAFAPGTVLGSTYIKANKAAYETVIKAIDGELAYGTNEEVGIKEGYISFITDDENFTNFVPEEIQVKLKEMLEQFNTGAVHYPMPNF